MNNRDEAKAFLSSRRAKITPEQAGLVHYSRNRRVPGLRRSEVADLAGVSVEYYAQLERGNLSGVSESVLDALARALQLDDAEREHLSISPVPPVHRHADDARPRCNQAELTRLLELMADVPAYVKNGRLDVLAINQLGQALLTPGVRRTCSGRSIWPGSRSSIPSHACGAPGNRLPMTPSRCCAPRRVATHTTAISAT